MPASPAGNTAWDQIRHHLDLNWPPKLSTGPITSSEQAAWMHPGLTFPFQWTPEEARAQQCPALEGVYAESGPVVSGALGKLLEVNGR